MQGLIDFMPQVVGLDWMFGAQKFRAHVLQHGVMAGGIIMGCAHSELVPAYVAIILGSIIAGPCVFFGLRYIFLTPLIYESFTHPPSDHSYVTPFMNKSKTFAFAPNISLIPKDTAGVLFAHGVPGFIGGIAGIAATADYKDAIRTHIYSALHELQLTVPCRVRSIRCGLVLEGPKLAGQQPCCYVGHLNGHWFVHLAPRKVVLCSFEIIAGLSAGLAVGAVLFVLRKVIPSEHVATKRRPVPALGFRPFHDEIAWRELPLDIDE